MSSKHGCRLLCLARRACCRPIKLLQNEHGAAGLADEIDGLLDSRTAAAPQPPPPPLLFGLSPAVLSKAVTAALLAVLLLWVGVSKLVDASGQHGEATDAAPPATAAPTPAAADMLPWMRQQPDHRALNERWGLPMGPSPQPPPEVLGHHIPRILHHSECLCLASPAVVARPAHCLAAWHRLGERLQ